MTKTMEMCVSEANGDWTSENNSKQWIRRVVSKSDDIYPPV